MGCDIILKATQVDGVYSADPRHDPNAVRYDRIIDCTGAARIGAAPLDAPLRDAAGRMALVAPAGAHFVAWSLEPGVAASSAEGVLTLNYGRLSVTLDLGSDADDWAAAISRLG